MSHKKKSDKHWDDRLVKYVVDGHQWKGTGSAPPADVNHYARKKERAINDCKEKMASKPQRSEFFAPRGPGSACTCGYHEKAKRQRVSVQQPRANPSEYHLPRPPKEIPSRFPAKPSPRTSLGDLKNKSDLLTGDRSFGFPLQPFGYTCGKCIDPSCRGDIREESNKPHPAVRTVHTDGLPKFVQGITLHCGTCGKTFSSLIKKYVDTLPLKLQEELGAVIWGRGDGISSELISKMRNGAYGAQLAKAVRAKVYKAYCSWKEDYDLRCKSEQQYYDVLKRSFPPFPEEFCPSAGQLLNGFVHDFETERAHLLREMAALCSEHALAVDHQRKVVKTAKEAEGEMHGQSFCVVGDGGLILFYGVVPDPGKKWTDAAMEEIVRRHDGKPPPIVYVDCDCCNGLEGGRTDETALWHGMLKKLDSMHCMKRISDEMNSEHPRKFSFMKRLSRCFFVDCPEDVAKLEAIRARHPDVCGDLNDRQRKRDHRFIRRVIPYGKVVVKELLLLVKTMIAQDTIAKRNWESAEGKLPSNITAAHIAYPLITKKVWKAVRQQCVHLLNGCVSDETEMYLVVREEDYRGTGELLEVYISLRGTSKVEVVHSVFRKASMTWANIRSILFDARTLWLATNYNRERLRAQGLFALPAGVSPREAYGADVELADTDLPHGTEYGRMVLAQFEDAVNQSTGDIVDLDQEEETEAELLEAEKAFAADEGTDVESETEEDSTAGLADLGIPDEMGFSELEMVTGVIDGMLPEPSVAIPDCVGFSELEEVARSLDRAMGWDDEPPAPEDTSGRDLQVDAGAPDLGGADAMDLSNDGSCLEDIAGDLDAGDAAQQQQQWPMIRASSSGAEAIENAFQEALVSIGNDIGALSVAGFAACEEQANVLSQSIGVAPSELENFDRARIADAKSRLNVGRRRNQASLGPPAPPAFTPPMAKVWADYWSKRGSKGLRKWYESAKAEYNLLRLNATANDPPLLDVGFAAAAKFVKQLEEKNLRQVQNGEYDEHSRELVNRLDDHLSDPARAQALTFGCKPAAERAVHTTTARMLSTVAAAQPNTLVRHACQPLVSEQANAVLTGPPPLNCNATNNSMELASNAAVPLDRWSVEFRSLIADVVKEREDIVPRKDEQIVGKRNLCKICKKDKGFEFNGRPHKQLDTKANVFCPLADPGYIYDNHKKAKDERRRDTWRAAQAKARKRDKEAKVQDAEKNK